MDIDTAFKEGMELILDPDYSVLKFTAKKASFYYGLEVVNFDIE